MYVGALVLLAIFELCEVSTPWSDFVKSLRGLPGGNFEKVVWICTHSLLLRDDIGRYPTKCIYFSEPIGVFVVENYRNFESLVIKGKLRFTGLSEKLEK